MGGGFLKFPRLIAGIVKGMSKALSHLMTETVKNSQFIFRSTDIHNIFFKIMRVMLT